MQPLMEVISFTFPSQTTLIPVIGATIREYARQAGFSAKESDRFCLAYEEAASYAILMGYGQEEDLLRVQVSRTLTGLCLIIRAKGLPLDDEALPAFDPTRFATSEDATGLHTFLARKMVDELTFSMREEGEREICLLKHGPPMKAEKGMGSSKSATPSRRRPVTPHTVRMGRPEDAEDIARLALRAHGAVFFNEAIYYPARVCQMLERGEMISVVALSPNRELMGHCALVADTPGARVRELTYAFLDPRFKSPGVNEACFDLIREIARKMNLRAIRTLAVTNHVHSQRNDLQQGFRESALLLAASPAARSWRKNDGTRPGRISNILLMNHLVEDEERLLHAPAKHRSICEEIIQNLGRNRLFIEASAPVMPETSAQICSKSDYKEGWTEIQVIKYGQDTLKYIGEKLAMSCRQAIPVAYLSLPLSDPNTSLIADQVEGMGLFFAGIGINDEGADTLLLQHLNGVDPDYDSIQLASPFGRRLRDYVRKADPGSD